MAHGSDAQTNAVLRRLYPTDDELTYARRELLGPSEAPDRKGFREILRAMARSDVLLGAAHVERRETSSKIVATVLVFDSTVASPEEVESDKDCLQHRTAFLAQQFEWNGMTWEPCCNLFFSETDGPFGCCDED